MHAHLLHKFDVKYFNSKDPFESGEILILITPVGCVISHVTYPPILDIVLTIASWEAFLQRSFYTHGLVNGWNRTS